MATIKGVWVFNDTIKKHFEWLNEYQTENVKFTSNGQSFTDVYWNGIDDGNGNTVYHIYYADTLAVAGLYGDISNWENEAYKTVDFGSAEQEVSDEFLAWMQENATQQASGETATPTAEGVKSKLQSLITASNAKTGKSDANLTDAVKTLLEGYGQGGGGECSGKHIIEVDELPTENIDETAIYWDGESYYKAVAGKFTDIIEVSSGSATSVVDMYTEFGLTVELHQIKTKPTTEEELAEIVVTDMATGIAAIYFVEDVGDAFTYDGSAWTAMGAIGVISDTSEATADGTYVVCERWQKYVEYVAQPPLGTIAEIATETEMNELLSNDTNHGCLYRYVGMSTETYKQGEFYLISQDLDENKMFRKIIPTESEGLAYTLLDDGTYEVTRGDCNDAYVVIPPYHNGIVVTSIADEAFRYDYQLEGVVIPNTVTRIGAYAFAAATMALKYVTIPDSVNYIGAEAFSGAYCLKGVVIPEGVTEIFEKTFRNCTSLEYVVIPSTITSIGDYAFVTCVKLVDIYFNGTVAQWNAITIADTWNNDRVPATKVVCTDGEVAL